MKPLYRLVRILAVLAGCAEVLLVARCATAQQSTGSIEGRVLLREGQSPAGIRVEVTEITTETQVSLVSLDRTGHFVARDLPFALYDLDVRRDTSLLMTRRVLVNTNVPIEIVFDTLPEFRAQEIVVSDSHIDVARTGPHAFRGDIRLERYPAPNTTKQIETILLSTPGVVPDEDGRLHVRGEDAHLQYIVDGIPITANQTRIFSSLFNAQLVKSIDVLRGGLNAEYGVAAAGIVGITTKSGFDETFLAQGTYLLGTDGNSERTAEVGGPLGDKVAYYFGYGGSSSDRYLDPIRSFEPNHTRGTTDHTFGKVDLALNDHLDMVLLGSYNKTFYQVPNLRTDSVQDQTHNLKDIMGGARVNWGLTRTSLLSVLAYGRQAEDRVRSNGLDRIGPDSASRATAIARNERFFLGANRMQTAWGGEVSYSATPEWFDRPNAFKAGVSGEIYPLREFFTFAVVDTALAQGPEGDPRLLPYDLNRGGNPFVVDTGVEGKRIAAYIQDEVRFDRLTVNAGVRFDMFSLFEDESSISPRLGLGYSVSDDLLLRLSYNRIVMQAPLEYILTSSSDAARRLVGAEQGTVPTRVRSEKSNVIELGAAYRLNDYVNVDFAGYGKLIEDYIVKVELGSSGVIFPVNLKEGFVAGGELEFRLHEWNSLSGFFSISSAAAFGKRPEDGSSPISAGLILGEEGRNYSHPFAAEDMFPTEHNQLLTSVLNLNYKIANGVTATLQGRFDSGLPFDLADSNGVGLEPEAARKALQDRGYSNDVIDLLNLEMEEPGSPDKSVAPHATFDVALSADLAPYLPLPVKLTGAVINVLDTKYLYKFESSFGGTHFGQPRTFTVQASIRL